MVVVFSAAIVWADALQNGADRLAATQNSDGGWGWPLTGVSAPNTIGPIGMGLAQAYRFTGDTDHSAALGNVGAFLLTKTNNFSPSDGYLAAQLDRVFGGTTYTDHVKTNFYDQLAAGTYNRNGAGILYDTAGYVTICTSRAAGGQANMAAWDVGIGLVGAASVWADPEAWIAGTKAEINELDGNAYYDVIGLAGALYGLAFVGEDFDPTAGQHEAASSVKDLAEILATYQLSSGGFTYNSEATAAGNEANQETAYAILALNKVDRSSYADAMQGAASYLKSIQLSTGGWDNYPGDPDGENNELTGEALWAIAVAQGDASVKLVPNTLNVAPGSTVDVSVKMDVSIGFDMGALSIIILYDSNVFTYVGTNCGNLFTCDNLGFNVQNAGEFRAGAFWLPGEVHLAAGASGALFTITLQAKTDAAIGPSVLTFDTTAGNNEIADGDFYPRGYLYRHFDQPWRTPTAAITLAFI